MKNANPILNFRLGQEKELAVSINLVYSFSTGIHSLPDGKQPEPLRFGHMTLITETREASDTSEHA